MGVILKTIDILEKALLPYGHRFESVSLGRRKKDFVIIRDAADNTMTISAESPLYPFMTASSRLICGDKTMAYSLAESLSVTIPRSIYLERDEVDMKACETLLSECGMLIVKPAKSSVSNGLTLNITDMDQLEVAIKHAAEYSDEVVVQQQVTGDEIRFPVIDGKVRAAILRQTPRVVGDGASTLNELIVKENQERQKITDTMVAYPMLEGQFIDEHARNGEIVPAMGEIVELNKSTMVGGGASVYNVISTIDQSYIAIAEKLAKPLGRGFTVVDIMIQDFTKPATKDNFAFIEFNLTPALRLFYSARDGNHFKVAEEYLAPMIDKAIKREYL